MTLRPPSLLAGLDCRHHRRGHVTRHPSPPLPGGCALPLRPNSLPGGACLQHCAGIMIVLPSLGMVKRTLAASSFGGLPQFESQIALPSSLP
jgi:hypothetical protein